LLVLSSLLLLLLSEWLAFVGACFRHRVDIDREWRACDGLLLTDR
jgi:hypothetical protein